MVSDAPYVLPLLRMTNAHFFSFFVDSFRSGYRVAFAMTLFMNSDSISTTDSSRERVYTIGSINLLLFPVFSMR